VLCQTYFYIYMFDIVPAFLTSSLITKKAIVLLIYIRDKNRGGCKAIRLPEQLVHQLSDEGAALHGIGHVQPKAGLEKFGERMKKKTAEVICIHAFSRACFSMCNSRS